MAHTDRVQPGRFFLYKGTIRPEVSSRICMTMISKLTPMLHHLGLRDLGESEVEKRLVSMAIQCSDSIQAVALQPIGETRFWILSNGVVLYAAKTPRSNEYGILGVVDDGANLTGRINTADIGFTTTNIYLLCAEIVRLAETLSGHKEADPIIRSIHELSNRLEQMKALSSTQ